MYESLVVVGLSKVCRCFSFRCVVLYSCLILFFFIFPSLADEIRLLNIIVCRHAGSIGYKPLVNILKVFHQQRPGMRGGSKSRCNEIWHKGGVTGYVLGHKGEPSRKSLMPLVLLMRCLHVRTRIAYMYVVHVCKTCTTKCTSV